MCFAIGGFQGMLMVRVQGVNVLVEPENFHVARGHSFIPVNIDQRSAEVLSWNCIYSDGPTRSWYLNPAQHGSFAREIFWQLRLS